MREAWRAFRLGAYDTAERRFQSVVEAIPETDPRHLQALYGLATTCNLRMPIVTQDKERAREAYTHILNLAPESDLAAWSLLGMARMQHLVPIGEDPDTPAVREAYADVYRRFPNHYAGHEAFLYLQSTHVMTWEAGPAREAADALQGFIAHHPDSPLLSAACEVLASCHEVLDQPRERMEALIAGLESLVLDPDNPTQENSWRYWRIATLAEFEVGEFDIARRFYHRLLDEYPQDIRRYGAQNALRRMDALETRLRRAAAEGGAS